MSFPFRALTERYNSLVCLSCVFLDVIDSSVCVCVFCIPTGTMITSLDYGATRNGGLVNSFTHTTLPNNFSTMPHLHGNSNHHHHPAGPVVGSMVGPAAQTPHPHGTQHVRFGTLPVRTGDKVPPPYPAANGTANGGPNGYGPVGPLPHSSQQVQPVQTQVIYTSK